MSKTREALEAAREFIAADRAVFIECNEDPDGARSEADRPFYDEYDALLAQIDAALAEQQAIAAQSMALLDRLDRLDAAEAENERLLRDVRTGNDSIKSLCDERDKMLLELAQAKRDAERLMRFAARILNASRQFMSDVDGGDVQAFGVEAGLLVPFVADGPCWEECECDVASDFPLTCYRYSPEALAAINALQAAQKEQKDSETQR